MREPTDRHDEPLNVRVPRELLERIKKQMQTERRGNRSEMVRILLEDGLRHRPAQAQEE
jgi:Arc/MetJ-type ribon-helix-helix transcriptional regulator